MLILLSVCTLIIVLATLLPLVRITHWSVRGLDFPRLQILFLASALAIAQLLFLTSESVAALVMLVATLICVVVQLCWVLPYTPFWRQEVKSAPLEGGNSSLSVITSNVLKTNRNSAALIALVKEYKPDILVTLETDAWWEEQLSVLEPAMPHTVKCPLDNLYGMHVYSKLPFIKQELAFLVEEDVPSVHVTVSLQCGREVRLHCLHPAPPSPTENEESIERDAELLVVAKRVAQTQGPIVVTGDLNDVAWSTTTRLFRKISGLLDPRVGRGMFNTFHADYFFLRWPLDHLFHSEHFTLKKMQRLPSIGSDHFSLYTELAFSPKVGADQDGVDSTQADKERAGEIVNAAEAEAEVSVSDVPS